MGAKVDKCDIFLRGQGRHGQKIAMVFIENLLLTLVRLFHWNDGGKKADWSGLSRPCVR